MDALMRELRYRVIGYAMNIWDIISMVSRGTNPLSHLQASPFVSIAQK